MNSLYNKIISLPQPDDLNDNTNLCYLVYMGKLTTIADYFNNTLKLPSKNIKELIDHSLNKDGMSVLHISAFLGFKNIFLYMLTYSCDDMILDFNGRNFFHLLFYIGDSAILSLMLNWQRFCHKMISMQNIDSINKSHGFSKLDIIKGKLSKGVNLTETNLKRFSSLQIKLKEETMNLISRNIDNLAKYINRQDKEGRNPLHYAAMNKYSLCYLVVNTFLDYEFFKMDGWEDFLKLHSDIQDLEIKPDRVVDPRKSLRIVKELENLLGENIIKDMVKVFNTKKKELFKHAINMKDNQGDTVLHIAAFHGDFRIVNKLLAYGASKNALNEAGKLPVDLAKDDYVRKVLTSLNKAAKNSDSKSIVELVNFGHNINNKTSIFSQAPLHKIIESTQEEKYTVLKKVLDMGADPSIKDSNGWTALHYACQIGDKKSVEILLDFGAKLDDFSNNNRTPLHLAANNNYPEIVNILVLRSADPNYKDHYGCTPLHLASKQGNVECLSILLSFHADLYSEDFRKWNILHYASFHGHKEAVRFICKYDSDLCQLLCSRNSQNKLPIEIAKTPQVKPFFISLWNASRDGSLDIIKQLINEGEDANEQTIYLQNTPLHLAVFNNHYLAVRLLLENGADSSLRNKDGITAVDYAEVINNVVIDKYREGQENEVVSFVSLVKNILNKNEKILKALITSANESVRFWKINDFSCKIRKLLTGNETTKTA